MYSIGTFSISLILFVVAIFLCVKKKCFLWGGWFFLATAGFWIVRDLFQQLDPIFIFRLFSIATFSDALSIVAREYRVVWRGVSEFFCLGAVLGYIRYFSFTAKDSIAFSKTTRRIYYVYLLGGVVSLLLIFLDKGQSSTTNASFWQGIHRYNGIFTDPNALGIVAGLMFLLNISLARNTNRSIVVCGGLVWAALGCLSGSRTFFLLLGVGSLGALWKRARSLLLFGIGVFTLSFIAIQWIDFSFCRNSMYLNGIGRTMTSLQIANFVPQLESRFIFWWIDLRLWWENPFFGVGFNHFEPHLRRIITTEMPSLGSWQDNPNSFYLGILCELGLVGASLFIIAVSSTRIKRDATVISLSAAIACIVSLFIGNHFDFPDVVMPMALVLGASVQEFTPLSKKKQYACLALLGVLMLHVGLEPAPPNVGIYRRAEALHVRRRAVVSLLCDHSYRISAPWLQPGMTPLLGTFSYRTKNKPFNEFWMTFNDAAVQKVHIPCADAEESKLPLLLRIECSRFYYTDRPYCLRIQ